MFWRNALARWCLALVCQLPSFAVFFLTPFVWYIYLPAGLWAAGANVLFTDSRAPYLNSVLLLQSFIWLSATSICVIRNLLS